MSKHYYSISQHGDLCISWYGDDTRKQVLIFKDELDRMTPERICFWFDKVFSQGSQWKAEEIRYVLGVK